MFFSARVSIAAAAVGCSIAGCERAGAPAGEVRDDFGTPVTLGAPPERIVSLAPATTEILFAIGAGGRLVGRSDYDLWPDSARLVPSVGNGIKPNVEAVLGARPDLVVLYASEENRASANRLNAAGVRTLSLRIDQISEFTRATALLGQVLGEERRARTVTDSVEKTLATVRNATARLRRPRVFWHIWDAPLITIGSGSFLSELVEIAGAENVYADLTKPSATISLEDVARRDPEFILAAPIGAERMRADARWKIVRAMREGKVLVVDTTLVARPAVKLGEAARSLARLLHPDAVP